MGEELGVNHFLLSAGQLEMLPPPTSNDFAPQKKGEDFTLWTLFENKF